MFKWAVLFKGAVDDCRESCACISSGNRMVLCMPWYCFRDHPHLSSAFFLFIRHHKALAIAFTSLWTSSKLLSMFFGWLITENLTAPLQSLYIQPAIFKSHFSQAAVSLFVLEGLLHITPSYLKSLSISVPTLKLLATCDGSTSGCGTQADFRWSICFTQCRRTHYARSKHSLRIFERAASCVSGGSSAGQFGRKSQ